MRRAANGYLLVVPALLLVGAGAVAAAEARLEFDAAGATVGDALPATLTLELGPGEAFEPVSLGSEAGPFQIEGGSWSPPPEGGPAGRWVWTGRLVAFRTGRLEIPPIELRVSGESGPTGVSTAPVAVTIESVLAGEEVAGEPPEIADLKPPASIDPRYGPLWAALGGLLLLLGAAFLLWWLHRRYAAKLAALPAPDDPFHRTPPHVWVYAELQRLLARRLAEEGQVDLFYQELSRILKTYLGGRYRVDLLEHTTDEIPARLRQAGAGAEPIGEVAALLAECDQVKFARHRPGPADSRIAVERVYRIVDTTKPADADGEAVRRGAA